MKTLLIILSFIILSVVTVQSQTYNKNYADGMLYVKLKKPIDETHLNKNSRSNCFIDLQAKFPAISSIKSFVT
nr:hypothetical protein [Bacteroidales bacterium]